MIYTITRKVKPKGGKMFKLHSKYKPTGDQPEAIDTLVDGIKKGYKGETL